MVSNDEEYKKILYDIINAACYVKERREILNDLNNRKLEIHETLVSFVEDSLCPSKQGFQKYDKSGEKYIYQVHFRIPIKKKSKKKIGFFFYVYWGGAHFRVRDYSVEYSGKDAGPRDLYLIMDYAEELIEKARARMKLTKYNTKYDLSWLIDMLHTLIVLRGDSYLVREGIPPPKRIAIGTVDPVTGKKKKIRASNLNTPYTFKITRKE